MVRVGTATDVGRHRTLNEDAMYAGHRLFVVADGMGGHAAGDVASSLAVETLRRVDRAGLTAEDVRDAVTAANDAVLTHAHANPGSEGMGCTLAGAALVEACGSPHWAVFNVGDARVYLSDVGQLTQLTTDHSEVEELVAAGQITRAEARRHPLRNIVTRAIGEVPAAPLDLVLVPVSAGQRVLVTSDGLTGEVEDAQIEQVLATSPDPEVAADGLIRLALEAGGHDNITVVVVDVVGEEAARTSRTTIPRGLIGRDITS